MLFAVGKRTAYLGEKDRAVLFCKRALSLVRVKVGISVVRLLRGDEGHVPFEIQIDDGKSLLRFFERVADCANYP